jgi:hypothetical protein
MNRLSIATAFLLTAFLAMGCSECKPESAPEGRAEVSPQPTAAAPAEEPEPSEECGKPGEEGHRVVSVLFEAPSSLDPEEQRERLERLATRFGGSTGQGVLLEGGGFEIPIAVPSESCPALLEALFQ